MSGGMKDDSGKLRYELIDDAAEAEMVAVLTTGAAKYEANNWRNVVPLYDRYYAALRRHLRAYRSGQHIDPASNLHHLAEAACCVHFMLATALHEMGAGMSLDARMPEAMRLALEAKAIRGG